MTETTINKLKNHEGKEVTIKGWLFNKRSSGKIAFSSKTAPALSGRCSKTNCRRMSSTCAKRLAESSVIVTGIEEGRKGSQRV